MALTFNLLLRDAGVDPRDTRLLRHETSRHGLTPYALWRDDPIRFDDYQRVQKVARRGYFASPYWAAFVVPPGGGTLFVGLYAVGATGLVPPGWRDPISGRDTDSLADHELYALTHVDPLSAYIGRLAVDWGERKSRQWAQRADKQDKSVVELRRTTIDPPFPGYAAFRAQLSDMAALPPGWRDALSAGKGVYLLTCPRTREQYVGSATGEEGFLGRWLAYAIDGHGGNRGLRVRTPADYRVSILQVAGSADDRDAVLAMEAVWKEKLQSREMGLNRN